MIVYEKNNKLNINFDNEISENPDLQISKEDGKTKIVVDGQPGGSGGGVFICTNNNGTLDKTMGEIQTAFLRGDSIILKELGDGFVDYTISSLFEVYYNERGNNYLGAVYFGRKSFSVSGATEGDALAAYPVLDE